MTSCELREKYSKLSLERVKEILRISGSQFCNSYDEFGNLTFYGELLAGKGLLEQV
jgi:hypothetical protein